MLHIGGAPITYAPVDQETAIEKGYEGNGTVYFVVKKDAKKFAYIPRYVYSITGKNKKVVENDLSTLLQRPNEYQGQSAFFEAVRGFYDVTGEAFIWLNRGDTDKIDPSDPDELRLIERTEDEIDAMPVVEMYVMPSNRVNIVPDPLNVYGIAGYEFDTGGTKIPIRKNDVIHWRSTNMSFDQHSREHLRGMTPFKPGKRFLQQDNDSTDSAVRMFQNDGARGLAFNETYDDLTVTQMSDARSVIDRRINNNDIKGAIATVQGKWGYVNFGGTAVDNDLIKSMDKSLRNICNLIGVPPEFFIDTNYENKNMAMRGWVLHDILPACCQFDDELNRILIPSFGLKPGKFKIMTDGSELPELQDDMQKLVMSLTAAWWISPNEKRIAMKYEPSPMPEMDKIYITSGLTPIDEPMDDGFDDMTSELDDEDQNDAR